ncbi:MAG: hypothetical protein QG549_370, partial [Patescibacteria group bacterium]|nr:hypothetical protein [Patescibacteria group bacterium]
YRPEIPEKLLGNLCHDKKTY